MKNLITLIPYAKISFMGGVLTFMFALLGFLIVGRIYNDTQARGLIEALSPSVRTLCFAVITSSSTIIPLLLTVLSVARRSDTDFNQNFYRQVKVIAVLGTVALASATLLLLFVSIPVTESENLEAWFAIVYFIIVIGSAWVSGLLISISITLYYTLIGVINKLTPSFD